MKIKSHFLNVFYYLQGNIRYRLIDTWFKFLIPKYIREQIKVRIRSMNPQCYNQGSCIACGCTTTQLQMANKACENDCYPEMLSRKLWTKINNNRLIGLGDKAWMISPNGKFKSYNRVR